MCRPTFSFLKAAILLNIQLTCLPWQPYNYMLTFMTKMKGNVSLSHFYNIDHTNANLVCICRSTSPLFITAILPNIWLICLGNHLYYLGIAQHTDIILT